MPRVSFFDTLGRSCSCTSAPGALSRFVNRLHKGCALRLAEWRNRLGLTGCKVCMFLLPHLRGDSFSGTYLLVSCYPCGRPVERRLGPCRPSGATRPWKIRSARHGPTSRISMSTRLWLSLFLKMELRARRPPITSPDQASLLAYLHRGTTSTPHPNEVVRTFSSWAEYRPLQFSSVASRAAELLPERAICCIRSSRGIIWPSRIGLVAPHATRR